MSSLSQFIGATTSKAGVVRLTDSVSSTSTTTAGTAAAVKVAYDAAQAAIPVGGIILWSGTVASIPANWALCNGLNNTPDLRNAFVIGAFSDAVIDGVNKAATTITGAATKTGGTKDAVVVSHSHITGSNVVLYNIQPGGAPLTGGSLNNAAIPPNPAKESSTTGESGTNKNLPPYYALAYIMRIA